MTNKHTQGTRGTEKPSQITKPTKTGKNIKTNAETPKKKLRKEGLRQRTSSRNKPKHVPQSRKCSKIPDQVPQRVLPPVLEKKGSGAGGNGGKSPTGSAMEKETTVYI